MTPPPRRARRPAAAPDPRHRRGAAGEDAALAWLTARGLRPVARRLRTQLGEIDLLLRDERTYVAVEVKARSGPAAERAVGERQLRRVARALRALVPTLRPRPASLRVDVVAVELGPDGGARAIRWFPGRPFDPR
ncbi:MAG: YraN family protein [Planctomycetes bacterium]|nr:YraN family protein [Planctomycetota bacterium]